MCTVKHVTFDTEVACFPGGTPILARKVAFGPRAAAKARRKSRYIRTVNPAREGIRTYIYIYIEASVVALIPPLILDAAASCGRGSVRCLERAKRACSLQTVFVRA